VGLAGRSPVTNDTAVLTGRPGVTGAAPDLTQP
jgi:hypothetical protein